MLMIHAAQHLLHMIDRWLSWAGMDAKPSKCHCLALAGSTGKLVDPRFRVREFHLLPIDYEIPGVRDSDTN